MNQVTHTHTRVRSTLSTFVLTFNGHKSKKRFRSYIFMHGYGEICRIIENSICKIDEWNRLFCIDEYIKCKIASPKNTLSIVCKV